MELPVCRELLLGSGLVELVEGLLTRFVPRGRDEPVLVTAHADLPAE